jgi:hypothetical protein
MDDRLKIFLVRCTHDQYAGLVAAAAVLGYGSATATSSRPGVARYLVDRGLCAGVFLSREDRMLLRRLLTAIRDATAMMDRLRQDVWIHGETETEDVQRALDALAESAELLVKAGLTGGAR